MNTITIQVNSKTKKAGRFSATTLEKARFDNSLKRAIAQSLRTLADAIEDHALLYPDYETEGWKATIEEEKGGVL